MDLSDPNWSIAGVWQVQGGAEISPSYAFPTQHLVFALDSTAPSRWVRAGYCYPWLELPGPGRTQLKSQVIHRQQATLVILPDVASEFGFRFVPVRWLPVSTLTVWFWSAPYEPSQPVYVP